MLAHASDFVEPLNSKTTSQAGDAHCARTAVAAVDAESHRSGLLGSVAVGSGLQRFFKSVAAWLGEKNTPEVPPEVVVLDPVAPPVVPVVPAPVEGVVVLPPVVPVAVDAWVFSRAIAPKRSRSLLRLFSISPHCASKSATRRSREARRPRLLEIMFRVSRQRFVGRPRASPCEKCLRKVPAKVEAALGSWGNHLRGLTRINSLGNSRKSSARQPGRGAASAANPESVRRQGFRVQRGEAVAPSVASCASTHSIQWRTGTSVPACR